MTLPSPNSGSNLPPQRRQPGAGLVRGIGVGALAIAVVVGIQLGRVPYRYRRQIWQFQGFAAGALLGYVVGRISQGDRQRASGDGERPGNRLP